MESSKKQKVSSKEGAFLTVQLPAVEFRKRLSEEENLTYIKDYFFSNADENHASDYIKAGGSVTELVDALKKIDLRRREQSTIIFGALHLVIIKSISEKVDRSELEEECRQFIASYIGELQSVLTSNTIQKHKKTVLKLLASISVQSYRLAGQILSSLTLTKEDVNVLVPQLDPADDQSLRCTFIHFVLSFIISQNSKIIEKLISKETWLPSIFPELRYDLAFTVQLVLSTLEAKIIDNTSISKTIKLRVFNGSLLHHISELYTWNPLVWYDLRPQATCKVTFSADELSSIRTWTHSLLMKICTSSKLGVIFQDTLYGTSNTQKNYNLVNFFQRLKDPWEDTLKKELVHKTLITCPDLVKPVLISLGPQLKTFSSRWLDIIQFVTNILNNVNINLKEQNLKLCLDTVQDVIVPKPVLESIKTGNFFKAESISVKLNTAKFISNILSNYSKIYNELKEKHSEFSIQSSMTPFFMHNLPSSVLLLELLSKSFSSRDQSMIDEIIKLLHLYDEICPTMIDIIRFDDSITNWIEEITGENAMNQTESDINLILSLIRLETIIYPHDPYKDKFFNRLKWSTVKDDVESKEVSVSILKDLLGKSGLFIKNPNELPLWIYCIEKFFCKDLGELLASSLKWAVENTNDIYKILLEAQEESATDEVSDLNLDDFLKISANIDNIHGLPEASSNSILLLSPLLPSILQVLSNENYKLVNDDFLVAFLVFYFHRLASVNSYVSLLKTYPCSTVSKVMSYFESWTCKPTPFDMPPLSSSLFSKASKFILKGKGNIDEINSINMTKQEAELLLEESLFMACELSRLGKATPERLDRILSLIEFCLGYGGLKINTNHSALLSDFHPLRSVVDSDLTNLVLLIAEHTQNSSHFLDPLTHRLAFELKYAKKTVHSLEDMPKLLKLLQIFRFSKSEVVDLLNYVFLMKSKYFEINGKLSPWAAVAAHLIQLATEYQLTIEEQKLTFFLKSLTSLLEKSLDIAQICHVLLNYLKNVYSEHMNGAVLDSFKDFFYTLCNSSHWQEELSVYIFQYMDDTDFSSIPVERTITLLSSLESYDKKHVSVLLDSAGIIFQGLCERPSPKWMNDLCKVKSIISLDTCKKISKKVKKHIKDVNISIETLNCMEMIFMKSEEIYSLYSLILDWLTESMSISNFNQLLSEKMCIILKKILDGEVDESALEMTSNDLVMSLLLQGLKLPSSPMLDLIDSLVKNKGTKLPPGEIFELLCSHSCFLDVLLSSQDAKYDAINLMLGLLNRDSSLINSTHVPVLLSSYNATLSKVDQKILKILQMYEKIGGINLACWKPYVWGEAAVDHYSVRSKITPSKQNPTATLELFKKDIVQATITNFPLHRDLTDEYDDEEDIQIYDPAFYLPLLSQLVTEGIGGWKLAGSGAVGLTLSCLASSKPAIRAAAYHVLFRFYNTMPIHNDNTIWKNFIEALRGGIIDLREGDNVQLSSIVTTFFARASIIMTNPAEPLYLTLHNFVYAKPHLKLNTVPAFLEMFHSTRGNHRLHQRWLLEVLRDGLREQMDLQIVLNSLTLKFLLDFHSCSLATPRTKELIEAIVIKCIKGVDDKQLLINRYSIIPWIVCANPKMMNDVPFKLRDHYKNTIK